MVEFAVDEGGEVPDHLVGGERAGQHGGVGDPLLRPGDSVWVPATSSQQGIGGLHVGVLQILLLQPGQISVSRPLAERSKRSR